MVSILVMYNKKDGYRINFIHLVVVTQILYCCVHMYWHAVFASCRKAAAVCPSQVIRLEFSWSQYFYYILLVVIAVTIVMSTWYWYWRSMICWFPPRVSLPAPVTGLEVYSMVGGGAQVVDHDEGLLAAPPDMLQSRTVCLFPLRVGHAGLKACLMVGEGAQLLTVTRGLWLYLPIFTVTNGLRLACLWSEWVSEWTVS